MKHIRDTINIFAISIFAIYIASSPLLVSCSKDDPATPTVLAPLQDPLLGYLKATGFDEKSSAEIDSWDNEHGISFIPLVSGKITAIVLKSPVVLSNIRVTVWDKSDGRVLRTEYIDAPVAGLEAVKQIIALEIVKGKEYFFTLNRNDWYYRSRNIRKAVVYPFTIGDIKITSFAIKNGTTEQVMPTTPINDGFFGDCSFKFQK